MLVAANDPGKCMHNYLHFSCDFFTQCIMISMCVCSVLLEQIQSMTGGHGLGEA